jgi:hypothetical protein
MSGHFRGPGVWNLDVERGVLSAFLVRDNGDIYHTSALKIRSKFKTSDKRDELEDPAT